MYTSTMKIAFVPCPLPSPPSTISPFRGKPPLKMAQYAGDYFLLISDQRASLYKIQR
jgi:hypothetical protein